MFTIDTRQAKAELREQGEGDAVIGLLEQRGYRPLLRSIARASAQAAGLQSNTVPTASLINPELLYRRRPGGESVVVGDILFKDNAAFLVQPADARLHVWEIRRHELPSACDRICEDVEWAIRVGLDGRRVRGMDFNWKRAPLEQRRSLARTPFQEGKLETKPARIDAAESAAAQLISQAEIRAPLLRLAQVGKARPADATLQAEEGAVQALIKAGLIRKEYLLLCRQDSHTICVVPDKDRLESGSVGMRCSVCGRAFDAELVQEIYAVTEFGRRMLASSHWMTVWITDLLKSAGVPEQDIAWNAAAGQDELDIIVTLSGMRLFFELKDREFGLGDAYPFAARVSRYGGTYGIIATTEKVADEAKKFLDEQRRSGAGITVYTAAGHAEISGKLVSMMDGMSRVAIRRLLNDVAAPTGINLLSVLDAWMVDVARMERETLLACVTPIVPAASAVLPGASPAADGSRPVDESGVTMR